MTAAGYGSCSNNRRLHARRVSGDGGADGDDGDMAEDGTRWAAGAATAASNNRRHQGQDGQTVR